MSTDSAPTPFPLRSHAFSGPLLAGLLPVLLLLPFANKAFHIDDYVYVRVAQQITAHPLDFYGFDLNWGKKFRSVADINKNPPGVSYFIAAVGPWTGWKEWPQHLWFLVPVFLTGVGTFRLAEHFTDKPLIAALASGLTPAFLVSSSNVMCEPLLLACYVWGVERWVVGLKTGRTSALVTAGVLIGLGTLTKYLVLTAVPLLAAYTVAHDRRVSARLALLIIPAAFAVAYDAYYYAMYGLSAWLWSGSFALSSPGAIDASDRLAHLLINFSFLGGAFITPFMLIASAQRRMVAGAAAAFVGVAAYVVGRGGLDAEYGLYAAGGIRWSYLVQLALFIAAGAALMSEAIRQTYRYRDPGSILVLLWIGGMFVFSGYVNWSINVRALLPAAPAIGILAARGLGTSRRLPKWTPTACLAAGAVVSLAALYGDYANAESGRQAGLRAKAIATKGESMEPPAARFLFQGHLGFQWYMEAAGYEHIVLEDDPEGGHLFASLADYGFQTGDVCAVKEDAAIIDLSTSDCRLIEEVEVSDSRWVATMNTRGGAGFYTAFMGELPYYFGPVEPERITFYQVVNAQGAPRE